MLFLFSFEIQKKKKLKNFNNAIIEIHWRLLVVISFFLFLRCCKNVNVTVNSH